MPQKSKQKDRPLKVNAVYAPPSPEADEAWLRALKILMGCEPKEEGNDRTAT
jgi:hypothetical protein